MKNFKRIAALSIACVMLAGCTSCGAENNENGNDEITVTINGNAVAFDQQPVIIDGRTLVPVRAIFEALGAEVDWDGDTQTVTSTRDNTTVSLTIGSNIMTKNSISYELDVPAQIVGERALVPVRAIAEAFGNGVDWNAETRTVVISNNSNLPEVSEISASALNNTYITQFGTVNGISCPQFAFDYSDNWTVTNSEVGFDEESVTLTNSRGVEIKYMDLGQLGGSGKNMDRYEVSKVADSQFVPGYACGTDTNYSYLGDFMVGRIEVTGELFIGLDDDYKPISGKESYAVMPESYIGTREATGLTGYLEEFSFEYPRKYIFYAEAPDGNFTEEEKQEVIEILSTFRVTNNY